MWQTLTAIGVPLLSIVIGLFRGAGDSRMSRRLKHHIDLLNALKEYEKPKAAMCDLITDEIEALQKQETNRRARKLNGWNLVLSIILGLATAGFTSWLTWFITNHREEPLAGWGIAFLSAAALFSFLFTIAGFSTIFEQPKRKTENATNADVGDASDETESSD